MNTGLTLTVPSQIGSDRMTALVSAKGKTYGTRVVFGGVNKASDVRAALKAADAKLKGRALDEQVNAVLSGRVSMAKAEFAAMTSALMDAGYQPDVMDIRKGGATARLVKPADLKSGVASAKATVAKLSADERAELLAFLQITETDVAATSVAK